MEGKDFDGWIRVKESLHFEGTFRSIKEGEIWWCSVGENVGVEVNGKQELFLRPVLIMKKLSRFGFMAIPLTSKKNMKVHGILDLYSRTRLNTRIFRRLE